MSVLVECLTCRVQDSVTDMSAADVWETGHQCAGKPYPLRVGGRAGVLERPAPPAAREGDTPGCEFGRTEVLDVQMLARRVIATGEVHWLEKHGWWVNAGVHGHIVDAFVVDDSVWPTEQRS